LPEDDFFIGERSFTSDNLQTKREDSEARLPEMTFWYRRVIPTFGNPMHR